MSNLEIRHSGVIKVKQWDRQRDCKRDCKVFGYIMSKTKAMVIVRAHWKCIDNTNITKLKKLKKVEIVVVWDHIWAFWANNRFWLYFEQAQALPFRKFCTFQ